RAMLERLRARAGRHPVGTRGRALEDVLASIRAYAEHFAVEDDFAAVALDRLSERRRDRPDRAARIHELLARGARPAQPATEDELRPQPREWDPLGVVAELREHERSPHRVERARSTLAAQPLERRDVVHRLPVGTPLQA